MLDGRALPTLHRFARALSLVLLLAINLFNYIDRYILAAVEPLVRAEFFAKDDKEAKFWMGMLAWAFLISYMVIAPLFGWLGDRTRRWALIGAGVIIWSLASGGSGLAVGFGLLLCTRMLVGIGEAAYGPIAPTIIADLYPVSKRGAVLSWFYMAIPVGSALGYVIGGQISQHWGWRWAFYVVVLPGILLGILAFFRPEPARGQADAALVKRSTRLSDYRVLLRIRSYVLNTAGMTAMTFALGGLAFWMPTYIHEERGQSDLARVNLIFGGVTVVAGLTGTLAGGYLADALRKRFPGSYFTVSGIGMLLGFPFFVLTMLMPFPWAWVAMFVAIFCLLLNTGPTNTIIANVTPPLLRSSAYAINIFVIHALGDAISPPLIGLISDRTGSMTYGFITVGVAFVIGAILWLMGASSLESDTAQATTRSVGDDHGDAAQKPSQTS